MIIPDTNLLVYAYNNGISQHVAARQWWEKLVAGKEIVGILWVVSTGFVRVMTLPNVLTSPLSTSDALGHVREWFQHEHIMPVNPEDDHLMHLHQILQVAGRGGNLVPDAHIAAIAMEHEAEVHTYNSRDFARFPGLRWLNPL